MKNFFNTVIDKTTGEVKSEFDSCIIRKVDKKDRSKIDSLTQKYDIKKKETLVPSKILNIKRFSKMLLFVSLVLWFLFFFMDLGTLSFLEFIKKELLLEILVILSLTGYIILLFVERRFKKKLQQTNVNQEAENSFQNILSYSFKSLGIENPKSLEVLSEQSVKKNGIVKNEKKTVFFNVILSVFIENDTLCFADLYSVIAIPLNSLLPLEKVEKSYLFKYWHKVDSPTTYMDFGIVASTHYAGSYYYALPFRYKNEVYAIFIPPYDVEAWKSLLEPKMEE